MDESAITDLLDGFEKIARTGGYRERVEALQMIDGMTWFDNFGEPYYRRRLRIAQELADDVRDDDVPEFLQEELDDL